MRDKMTNVGRISEVLTGPVLVDLFFIWRKHIHVLQAENNMMNTSEVSLRWYVKDWWLDLQMGGTGGKLEAERQVGGNFSSLGVRAKERW